VHFKTDRIVQQNSPKCDTFRGAHASPLPVWLSNWEDSPGKTSGFITVCGGKIAAESTLGTTGSLHGCVTSLRALSFLHRLSLSPWISTILTSPEGGGICTEYQPQTELRGHASLTWHIRISRVDLMN